MLENEPEILIGLLIITVIVFVVVIVICMDSLKIDEEIFIQQFLNESNKQLFISRNLEKFIKLKNCKDLLPLIEFDEDIYIYLLKNVDKYVYLVHERYLINYLKFCNKLLVMGVKYLPRDTYYCTNLCCIIESKLHSINKNVFDYYIKSYLLRHNDNVLLLQYNKFINYCTKEEIDEYIAENINEISDEVINTIKNKQLKDSLTMLKQLRGGE